MNPIQKMQNDRLRAYYAAEKAVLSGQSYTIGNRTLTRADLADIRDTLDDLINSGATLEDTTYKIRRSIRAVFRD